MKPIKLFFLSLLFTFCALAQNDRIQVPAPSSPSVNVTAVGLSGFSTYYYLVVANYPAGTTQSQIVTFSNGNATLSGSNYNQIGWNALAGALNYDILRLPSNSFTGSCTCSLAVAQSGTTYSDIGGGLSSYTIAASAAGATASWVLDNTDYAFPKLRLLIGPNGGNTANHLAEVPGGNTLPVYSTAGDIFILLSGNSQGCYISLVANAWVPCGSSGTSGSVLVPYTVGTGGVTANQPVKLTTTNTVVKLLTSDTAPDTAIGIAQSTVAATGTVLVAVAGNAPCVADTGGITAGNLIGAGTTVADTCVDLGTALVNAVAPNIQIIGRANTTSLATATSAITLFWETGAGYAATGTGNYVRATAPTLLNPLGLLVSCGTTAACPSTARALKVVQGSGTLVSGTPSTYAVTTISPAFTSASTYTCTAQDTTTVANNIGVLTAGYVSGSAVTFTGPATNTDTFNFVCVGYQVQQLNWLHWGVL